MDDVSKKAAAAMIKSLVGIAKRTTKNPEIRRLISYAESANGDTVEVADSFLDAVTFDLADAGFDGNTTVVVVSFTDERGAAHRVILI